MKSIFCKILLTLGMVLGICCFLSVKAQSSSNYLKDNLYFEVNRFQDDMQVKMLDLMKKSKDYLDSAKAVVQLESRKNAIVDLKYVKPHTQALKSDALAVLLQKSTIVFYTIYQLGKDSISLSPASGYVIDEDGIIVTNHHVVEALVLDEGVHTSGLGIATIDGDVFMVTEVLSTNKDKDLSILRVDTRGKKLAALPIGNPANQGAAVYVMSHPVDMLYYFTQGVVARNYIAPSFLNPKISLANMDITADYAVGSSGGPIVDNYGNLVSTVSATLSIYPDPEAKVDLQMVVKYTRPVSLLREMLKFK